MGAFAINQKNVFFIADHKMFSYGAVRLHAEGDLQLRSTPRAVNTPLLRHERFRHISANGVCSIENVCAISQGLHAAVFTWGDNYGSQQGTLFAVPQSAADGASQSGSESASYLSSASVDWGGTMETTWVADSQSDDAQTDEVQQQEEVEEEEEEEEVPLPEGEPPVRVGEIFSSNPVRRGREHFHGETPALAACSARSFFVVTESGSLWCVGDDKRARNLVHPDSQCQTFARVPRELFEGTDIVSLSVGQCHILAVCANGAVWGWGSNQYGALGFDDDDDDDDNDNDDSTYRTNPQKMDSTAWDHRRIIVVSAGDFHSNALSEDGVVWEWGLIHSQTERPPNSSATYFHFQCIPMRVHSNEVPFDGTAFQSVCCGSTFTLILSAQGQVWSCGLGPYGELGLGQGRQTTTRHPMRITQCDNGDDSLTDFGNANDPLVSISCVVDNCGAISQEGRVYVWGAKYMPDHPAGQEATIALPRLIMSRHHFLPAQSMAFSMAQHLRLGGDAPARQFSSEMYDMVVRPDMHF